MLKEKLKKYYMEMYLVKVGSNGIYRKKDCMSKISIIKEFWEFLRVCKKWW